MQVPQHTHGNMKQSITSVISNYETISESGFLFFFFDVSEALLSDLNKFIANETFPHRVCFGKAQVMTFMMAVLL